MCKITLQPGSPDINSIHCTQYIGLKKKKAALKMKVRICSLVGRKNITLEKDMDHTEHNVKELHV